MDDEAAKLQIKEVWDREAAIYDSYVSHGIQTDEEKELWKQAFSDVAGKGDSSKKVLDIGCGTGAMSLIFSELGYSVVGLDLSEDMMNVAKEKTELRGRTIQYVKGDAENPLFDPESFDIIVNRHLLWTLPNPQKALKNWNRVLKPGGKIIIVDGVWDDKKTYTKVKRNIGQFLSKLTNPKKRHARIYSKDLEKALPGIGGVPFERAKMYVQNAHFKNIRCKNMAHIRQNQYKRLKWYEKIYASSTYYLLSAEK